jgi:hypothetical protein
VIDRLLAAAVRLLEGPRLRRSLVRAASRLVTIETGRCGRGYGWPSPDGERALVLARADGLRLDPIYTAKAMAAALALEPGDPILYWHTRDDAWTPPPGRLTLPAWFAEPAGSPGSASRPT